MPILNSKQCRQNKSLKKIEMLNPKILSVLSNIATDT